MRKEERRERKDGEADVEKDVKQLNVNNWKEQAKNKDEWRHQPIRPKELIYIQQVGVGEKCQKQVKYVKNF